MTEKQSALWAKLEAFELDDPESSFTFSDRLARENNWSMSFALRAGLEYKKFMLLICLSDQPLTPSDEIDQVWHLHLLYTESYWIEFCRETLQRDIHHGPTRGAEERTRFGDQYQYTLDYYASVFGTEPPGDIWPAPEKRFDSIHFSRVNRRTHWVFPKINPFRK